MKRLTWCAAVLLLALPVAAQEAEPPPIEVEVVEEPVEEEETGIASRLHAAGWCVLRSERQRDQPADQPADSPGGVDEQPGDDESLGCDVGVAAALVGKDFGQGRLSLVGVLGAQSLGIGGAWTFGRQNGHPFSVALGLVAPYDSSGIYSGEWAVALGATVSVFGRR